jgi:hypothetical protein
MPKSIHCVVFEIGSMFIIDIVGGCYVDDCYACAATACCAWASSSRSGANAPVEWFVRRRSRSMNTLSTECMGGTRDEKMFMKRTVCRTMVL